MAGSTLTPSRYKYTLTASDPTQQLATAGGILVISVVCTGGSGGAAVRVHDSSVSVSGETTDSFLISANGGESVAYTPSRPVLMNNGLYVDLEQSSGNASAFITYDVA